MAYVGIARQRNVQILNHLELPATPPAHRAHPWPASAQRSDAPTPPGPQRLLQSTRLFNRPDNRPNAGRHRGLAATFPRTYCGNGVPGAVPFAANARKGLQ